MKYILAIAALAASMTAASAAPLPCYSQLFFGNVLPKVCPAGTNDRSVNQPVTSYKAVVTDVTNEDGSITQVVTYVRVTSYNSKSSNPGSAHGSEPTHGGWNR